MQSDYTMQVTYSGFSVYRVEYPGFFPSVGSACFEVTRWTSFFTMCYFLSVSYWLVPCNTVVLPGNVKLHVFLKGVRLAGVSTPHRSPQWTCWHLHILIFLQRHWAKERSEDGVHSSLWLKNQVYNSPANKKLTFIVITILRTIMIRIHRWHLIPIVLKLFVLLWEEGRK